MVGRAWPLISAVLGIGTLIATRPLGVPTRPPKTTFASPPWIEDFDHLRQEMSSHYANVEWAVDQRGMELPRLRAETEDALRQARDDAEARRILERFVDAFGDGHLEIWRLGGRGKRRSDAVFIHWWPQ